MKKIIISIVLVLLITYSSIISVHALRLNNNLSKCLVDNLNCKDNEMKLKVELDEQARAYSNVKDEIYDLSMKVGIFDLVADLGASFKDMDGLYELKGEDRTNKIVQVSRDMTINDRILRIRQKFDFMDFELNVRRIVLENKENLIMELTSE